MTAKKSPEDILCINFNQNHKCFTCGTTTGFNVYNTDPFRVIMSRKIEGGISHIEMLYVTNLFAFVGSGKNPLYPSNKVIIWDEHRQKNIAELIFRSIVRNVKLKRDKIYVVLDNKVKLYNFTDLKLLEEIDTCENATGLFGVAGDQTTNIYTYPSTDIGTVTVVTNDAKKTKINAHVNELACIALNYNGTMIATASNRGTLIRVFDTTSGNKLYEFRRGLDTTTIQNICFDINSKWLVVTSTKETVHIFALANSEKDMLASATDNKQEVAKDTDKEKKEIAVEDVITNTMSTFAPFKDILPSFLVPSYITSEWSHKQLKIPDLNNGNIIVTFSNDKPTTLIAINSKGYYYSINYGKDIPEYTQKCYA